MSSSASPPPSTGESTGESELESTAEALSKRLAGAPKHREALWRARCGDPGAYLGPHAATIDGQQGTIVRVLRPDAHRVRVLPGGAGRSAGSIDAPAEAVDAEEVGPGLFAAWLPGVSPDAPYRLELHAPQVSAPNGAAGRPGAGSAARVVHDPYRFAPEISDYDLYLIAEGTHCELWRILGAHATTRSSGEAGDEPVPGFSFAVWAPNAQRVSLVGEFCDWDGRRLPMRPLGPSGIWELFVPDIAAGALYKYEIVGPDDAVRTKADPMASWAEEPPGTASRTYVSSYTWSDDAWRRRAESSRPREEPVAIYEVHLGSFLEPSEGDAPGQRPRYLDLAKALVERVKALGFTHIQLLPVAEHPFDGSWGYQITGYFAPTARYGDPDDFRAFVDHCHGEGIGVLLDWVPAHFVKDEHGLGRFDGTALYEHEDPRRGEHPDWGTYIFNYSRFEVRNFLVSNALYWLEEFHLDGLRIDAVASMLYLDYSRAEGEWLPNAHGGRENLEAIELLREINRRVRERCPWAFTVAEESTTWPRVTADPDRGGLGFTFKWNMGWMHDTLSYFTLDPLFRSHHQDQLTFAMLYEYSEAFINPLSHDEVVHGKGSLYRKMHGSESERLANLRCLFGYQYTRPGKVLLFMGAELAPEREWDHLRAFDPAILAEPGRRGLFAFLAALGALYQERSCLWRGDHDPAGFRWITCSDRERSVYAFARIDPHEGSHVIVVLNLTPVARRGYRIGADAPAYRLLLSSAERRFGGKSRAAAGSNAEPIATRQTPRDGLDHTLVLDLPPLSFQLLEPVEPVEPVEPS